MNTKNILSLLTLSTSLFLSFQSQAEDMSLLDIMPGEELKLNISFPKSVYKQNSVVVFRNGQVDSPMNRDPYQIGEYCEIYFQTDPSSMFSSTVNVQRTVKIKYVNEAWTHAPGSSRLEAGDHYRSGSNIWIENDDIQRISCYLVEKGGGTLSEKDINELAVIARMYGKSENEIAFLAEERLLYRISLSHLKRHLGGGSVALNKKDLNQLDYWDQQSRKLMTGVRKDIKSKGRAQYMKEEDEKAKLAQIARKLITIEGTYRRNFEVLPTESLNGNPHYQKYLNEQMKEQNFPQEIIDQVIAKII